MGDHLSHSTTEIDGRAAWMRLAAALALGALGTTGMWSHMVALPAVHGRGILNYDLGLMPYRRPVHIVVGKPIPVRRTAQPEQADIDTLHKQYLQELQNIWDAYKDVFAKDRRGELEFIN